MFYEVVPDGGAVPVETGSRPGQGAVLCISSANLFPQRRAAARVQSILCSKRQRGLCGAFKITIKEYSRETKTLNMQNAAKTEERNKTSFELSNQTRKVSFFSPFL